MYCLFFQIPNLQNKSAKNYQKAPINYNSMNEFSFTGLNTSYLTDSYISFTLKLGSGQNFCFDSLIRSSTYGKKNISDFPPCGKMVVFVTEFVIFLKTSK